MSCIEKRSHLVQVCIERIHCHTHLPLCWYGLSLIQQQTLTHTHERACDNVSYCAHTRFARRAYVSLRLCECAANALLTFALASSQSFFCLHTRCLCDASHFCYSHSDCCIRVQTFYRFTYTAVYQKKKFTSESAISSFGVKPIEKSLFQSKR